MLKKFTGGILSGFCSSLCISIGGCVYLACYDAESLLSRTIGAVFFCVALTAICSFGFSLYTGRIGGIIEDHTKENLRVLFSGLIGNLLSCLVYGYIVAIALPNLSETANVICSAKLTQDLLSALIRGYFCGVLMYIAVQVYKEKKSFIGIIFCIPAFVLSGFEHSIADAFYFFCGNMLKTDAVNTLIYLFVIIIGNSLGSFTLPLLRKGYGALNGSNNE